MTTRCALGPWMTLILTMTAKRNGTDNVIHPSRAAVVDSLLFARFVIEILNLKPAGYATPSGRALRIGSSQGC
ncbi:MAG: hypothetical protein WAN69_17325 [Candidatus Korobacteraceae bacterium]